MKNALSIVCIVSLLLVATVPPVIAEDAFHIDYRQADITTEGGTLSGTLIVSVLNTSGQSIQDVVVWVTGPNNVTYDNHQVVIGNLADGQWSEIVETINVPAELQTGEAADEVAWSVEFTNAVGTREMVSVLGNNVP